MVYEISESGPDHDKRFKAWAVLKDLRFGPGKGRNKKQAEQLAAEIAFNALAERREVNASVAESMGDA